MGFPPIPEKEAAGWPLLPDYGHYMGLNLGVFSQMGRYNSVNFGGWQSDGITDVFFWKTGRTGVIK
jgi:hypothetical protein